MAREEAEIKELTKKLEQNPDSMVFVQLADAYRRAGDLEKCVEICRAGLERHPTYTTARTILGRAYLDLNKLDEAASEFKKIEASDPENIVAQRMLGQIYMAKGMYADAITRHQKVLALDPDDNTAQEHLQEALIKAKQEPAGPGQPPAGPAPSSAPAEPAAKPPTAEQSGTLKVAEIYIKKGALDEATEVLSEILAADPSNALARQKLKEIEERRRQKSGPSKEEEAAKKKAEEEAAAARKKAEEEAAAKKKAEEEAAAAKKKSEEEAAAAKKKAEEEAAAKKKADEEAAAAAKKKADEEAAAAAKKKVEEEIAAKKKAGEEAAAAAKKKAEEEAAAAKKKAEEEAQAAKKAEEEEAKKRKLSSDDILSVMKADDDGLIDDHAPAPAAVKPAAVQPSPVAAPAAAGGLDPKVREHVAEFVKKNAIEANLVIAKDGKLLESGLPVGKDSAAMAQAASSIFSNTEKAAGRMRFGGLNQILVTVEDGRQILFVSLKAGVLVAVTGKNTNLGMLRIAINDLVKKA